MAFDPDAYLGAFDPDAYLSQPSVGMDIAKSGGVGLVKGGIGLAGMGGDMRELLASGINKGSAALSNLVPQIPQLPEGAASAGLRAFPFLGGPTAEKLRSGLESVTGPLYKPQTTAGEYAQTAGEFAPGMAMGPGGLLRRAATQVLAPALASETAGQATKGTAAEPYARVAGALASPLALSAVSRAVTPLPMNAARQSAVAALEGEGINLSAGQRSGSRPLQWFEQALGDIPGAGRGATTASERSAEQFTAATLRRAGENAPRATPEVIDSAFTRIGNQFDNLAARNTLHADPQMGRDIQAGLADYHGLVAPPNRAPVIQDFLTEIGTQLARNGNRIPGDAFQSLTSRIERSARAAKGAPEVADTLRDIRGALNDAMERSIANHGSHADLGAWREVRNQYRNMLTIERAATGAGENAALGLISPSQLRNATVAQNRRAYARGQGDFGELARSGEAVMKPLPQSGTAPRSYAQHLPAAIGAMLGGVAGGVPGAFLGGAAAIAGPPILGRMLMSRPIQGYLGNQLVGRAPPTPPQAHALRALLASQSGRGLLPL